MLPLNDVLCSGPRNGQEEERSFKCVLGDSQEAQHISGDLRWATASRVGRKGLQRFPYSSALSKWAESPSHVCLTAPCLPGSLHWQWWPLPNDTLAFIPSRVERPALTCSWFHWSSPWFVSFLFHCFPVIIISFLLLALGLICISSSTLIK